MTTTGTPPCPECSTETVPLTVDGEDVWRCPDPECGRRTYGTGSEDDDRALPTYTETGADGAVLVYHGNGHLDLEATAELAAQDGPDEEDEESADFLVVPPLDLVPGTLPFVARPAGREVVLVIDAEPEDSDAERAARLPFAVRPADGEPE